MSDQLPTFPTQSSTGIYSEEFKTIAKVVLSHIPLGAAINEAIYDAPSRIHQARFEKFVEFLKGKVENLDIAPTAFMKTDDFSDLISHIYHQAQQTKSELKIKTFTDIIIQSVSIDSDQQVERYNRNIEIISSLTDSEMIFLRNFLNEVNERYKDEKLVSREYFGKTILIMDYNQPTVLGLETNHSKIIIETLSIKRLIADSGHGFYGYTPNHSLGLTPLGKDLVEFIEEINS